jgi:beta-glucosidase
VDDQARASFIRGHLAAAREAISRDIALEGYFVWSLLDNFEWAEGYRRRFGVVHVDFATQKRTPKASFAVLPRIMGRSDIFPSSTRIERRE